MNYMLQWNKKIGYFYLIFPIVFLWVLGLLIALFSPLDVLSKFEYLRDYVNFVSIISMPSGAPLSSHPQVYKLYSSVVFWSFPFWFFILLKWFKYREMVGGEGPLLKENPSVSDRFVLILFLPLWIILLYAVRFNHGGDVRFFSLGTSRAALGCFGMLVWFGAAGMLGLIFQSIKKIISVK